MYINFRLQFIFFEISFLCKINAIQGGCFNKLRETTHASIHAVRRGSNGIWSHVDCCTSRQSQWPAAAKRESVLYIFNNKRLTGLAMGVLGILSPDGKRGRGSSASPQTSLLPLTAPSQRMRRSFFDRVMRWTF